MLSVQEKVDLLDEVMEVLCEIQECEYSVRRESDRAKQLESARFLGQAEQRLMWLQARYDEDAYEQAQREKKVKLAKPKKQSTTHAR